MGVVTIPLKKKTLPPGAAKPALAPVLHDGPRCPLCGRNYWLGWEPDEDVIRDKRELRSLRIQWAMVGVFALFAGLFFVGAILFALGGRL